MAQSPAGKEFIVTLPSFLPTPERNADDARFMVEIMCPRRTQVTVKWSDGSPFANAEVQAGSRFVLMKPQFMLYQIMQSPLDLDVEVINRRAWVITTDQPVTVQALFDTNYRAENWMIYPVSSFDTAYTLVNYAGWGAGGRNGLILMASQDNTVVRITPSVQTWGAHYPNQEYTITLQKYQVYELLSTHISSGAEGDLTGTRIRSNNPVGVLSLSQGTTIPNYGKPSGSDPEAPAPHNEYNFSTKLMAEHQVPERFGGTTFYLMPYLFNDPATLHKVGLKDGRVRMARDSSHARFMVLDSPTTFDTNGVRVKGRSGNDSIFNRGMRFDFTYFGPMKVEASRPVLGATFMLSGFEPMRYDTVYTYDTVVITSGVPRTIQKLDSTIVPVGNPSMIWLPPVSEYKQNLQVAIPNLKSRPPLFASHFTMGWKHFLIVTAPATAANRVRVNGNPVTFGYTHKDGKYVSAYVKMLPGLREVIESPEPISVVSYGLNIADSYGTTAGESVRSNVQVIPDTLRFFSCSAEKDTFITLTNLGSGGFRIDSLSITGVSASVVFPAFTPPYFYGGTMSDRIVFRFTTPVPGVYNGVIRLYTDANNQEIFTVPFTITRDSAMLGLPATTIDLGALKSSESQRDTQIVVRNNGTRPLVITGVSFIGQGYKLVGVSFPDTVAPGASDTLLVRFTPTGDGLREAEMRIEGTPCMNNVSLHLRAFKGSGATVLVQRSLRYGSYLCEVPSSVDSLIELRSIGDEPVVITSAVIDGAQKEEFTLLDSLTNVTVLPGDTLRFRVRYAPGGYGERRAMLKLATNAKNGGTIEIELVARKDTVTLEAVRDTVAFGRVLVCEGVLEEVVRVRNTGTIADTVVSADLGGGSSYTIVSGLPVVVQPGTEQEVRVRFTASSDGSYPDAVTLRGSPCALEVRVALTAERVTPRLRLSGVDGSAVLFDTVYACDGIARRQVVLFNDGAVRDTVYGISDGGLGVFGIESSSSFPVVLAPGERDTVEIAYKPLAAGTHSADLIAEWGPCEGTSRTQVSGTYVVPSWEVSSSSMSFDSVVVDSVVRRSVMVRNTGTTSRTISEITLSGSSDVRVVRPSPLPVVIAAGDSIELELEWRPRSQGALSASVLVGISSPCGGDSTIAITGTATGETVIETSLTLVAPVVDGEQDHEVDLPIVIENWTNAESAGATAVRFRLSWRYTVVSPVSVTTGLSGMRGEIIDDVIEGVDRHVTIEVTGGSFPVNGELVRVRGLLLVGDTDRTALAIDSIEVVVPSNRVVHASKRDGELRVVGICRTGGDRYVTLNGGVRLKSVTPNPFREGAVIEFESDGVQRVAVRVYDSYGCEVKALLSGEVSGGVHSVYLRGSDLPSGMYICELESNGLRQRAALLLLQ